MKKRILASLLAVCLVVSLMPTVAFADSNTDETLNLTVGNYTKKKKATSSGITSFDEAYEYYTNGNPNGKGPYRWIYDENDVAYVQLRNQTSATFEFATDDSEEEKVFEVTHDTCIVLREAVALQPDAVKEVTVTVNTPIVVKSGHYLILRSQGMGYSNEYTTVYLNYPIIVENGATLLLDGPAFGGTPTGPRDIYVGPESGPAIIAEEGSTVRLGGVILQPNEENDDAFIQAKGATVIVQAGNTTDTAKGTKPTGELPDVDETYYHSNTYAETSGSAPIIEASEGATVQLLGGNFVSTGDTPAITVDASSSIKIDMENAAWTNKHGQGVEAEGEGTSAVSIASGGTLELGEYAPATASDNETQAIDLAGGATVKKGTVEITVSQENDAAGDNYVDNYGNIILAAKTDENGTVSAAKVILDDGTTIEGTAETPLQITYEGDDESGETVTQVTVPANGSVQKPGEEKATVLPGGGTVDGDSNNITVNVAGVSLNETSKDELSIGDTFNLTATVSPENASNKTVTWTSSDEKVATVENGTVTAVGYGRATITAAVGGKTATCTVTVPAPYIPPVNPNPSYSITAPSVDNGTLSVSPSNATKDSTVIINVTPDKDYELASLTVVDANGNRVPVKQVSENKFTFTMPASKVTVNASFSKVVKELPFTDVSADDYFYDAVVWAVENGVTYGNTATTFGVGVTCNRADAVTFIWRAYGCPAPKNRENPFTDVAGNAYYADAVLWAVENGITVGTSATTFGPLESCRREHIVTFLYRAAGSPTVSHSSGFSDVADSAYYANAVTWAAENGITVGAGSATTFGPTQNCFREQIVTFLYRNLAE